MMNQAEVNILIRARDEVTSVFKNISAKAQELGQSMSRVLKSGADAASNALKGIGAQTGSIVKAGAAVAGLIGGFITIKDAVSSTQQLSGEVSKLARVSGLTAEESSHLLFAFRQTGLEADDAGRAIGILAKKLKGISDDETGLIEGGKQVSTIFKDLGIDATFADGEIRPLNELINELADKFKVMPNGLEKTGLAMQIFGKSGADLIPLLNQGSDGLRELAKEADKLGVTLSGKNLEQVKKLTAAQRDLKEATSGIKLVIGAAFIPALTALNLVLVRLQPSLRKFIDDGLTVFSNALFTLVSFVVPPVIAAFQAIGDKLTFLKPVLEGLGLVVGGLAAAIITFGPALGMIMPVLLPLLGLIGSFLSPVGLLIIGIGALAIVFRKQFVDALKSVGSALLEAGTNVVNFVQLIGTALAGDVARAGELFNKLPKPLQDLALWLAEHKKDIEDFAAAVRDLAQDALAGWITILTNLWPKLQELGGWMKEHKEIALVLAIALGAVLAVLIGWPAVVIAIIVAVGVVVERMEAWRKKNEDLDTTLNALATTMALLETVIKETTKFVEEHEAAQVLLLAVLRQIAAPMLQGWVFLGLLAAAFEKATDVAYWFKDALYSVRDAAWAAGEAIGDAFDKLKVWKNLPGIGLAGDLWNKIPGNNAQGTRDYAGGLSWVGEQGPELMFVPRHANIYSNPESMSMAAGGGNAAPATMNITQTFNITGDATDRTIERMKQEMQDAAVRALTMSGLGGGFTPVGAYNQ